MGFFVLILLPMALVGGLLLRLFSLEAPQVPLGPHPPSRPGLWYCSHRATRGIPFQHLFIRLTPADPAWALRRPDLFRTVDGAGRRYCTLGAGPKEGKLFLEFNRSYDLGDPVSFEEPLPGPVGDEENARIAALLASFDAYDQSLEFAAWSRVSGPGYNCNSMTASLARRAGMPGPGFARHRFLCPGLGRRLPKEAFSDRLA